MTCIEPEASPVEFNILCSYVTHEVNRKQCNLGIIYAPSFKAHILQRPYTYVKVWGFRPVQQPGSNWDTGPQHLSLVGVEPIHRGDSL